MDTPQSILDKIKMCNTLCKVAMLSSLSSNNCINLSFKYEVQKLKEYNDVINEAKLVLGNVIAQKLSKELFEEAKGSLYDNHSYVIDGLLKQIRDYKKQLTKTINMETGIELIAKERQRQIEVEGWTVEHDEKNTAGELAYAAASYALPNDVINLNQTGCLFISIKRFWFFPFGLKWWKPRQNNHPLQRVRELTKAGALIAAEIDRINELNKE